MEALEIVQWAVILFLAVFVLGLTRQLGHFLTPSEEQRATRYGPETLVEVPAAVLQGEERARVGELIDARRAGVAAVIVVNDACDACETWIDAVEQPDFLGDVPLVVMTSSADGDYLARLQEVADVAIVDSRGERLRSANLNVWPFLMIVDARLRLVHKQVAGDLRGTVRRWSEETRPAPAQATAANGARVAAGGR